MDWCECEGKSGWFYGFWFKRLEEVDIYWGGVDWE